MITIELNGKTVTLPESINLAAALESWQYVAGTFAVAINECFVAKAQYAKTMIESGDRVEVVSAMQGG